MCPLALHDVNDGEALAAAIARRSRLSLSRDDREELVQFLLVELWKLSLTYDRGDPSYPPHFGVYATGVLQRRVVDWQRQRFGRTKWQFKDRTYERKRPELVPLDDDTVGTALASDWSDFEDGLYQCEPGVQHERDRQRVRDLQLLGLGPD